MYWWIHSRLRALSSTSLTCTSAFNISFFFFFLLEFLAQGYSVFHGILLFLGLLVFACLGTHHFIYLFIFYRGAGGGGHRACLDPNPAGAELIILDPGSQCGFLIIT